MKLVGLDRDLLPRWPSLLLRIGGLNPTAFEKTRIDSFPPGRSLSSSCGRTESAVVTAKKRNPTEGGAIMAEDDNTNNAQTHEPPRPKPTLRSLDVMVGTWELKGRESDPEGEIHGRPTLEWMEGGFYLVQHVDIDYIGRRIVGTEYIGYDEENDNLRSYFFSNEGPEPFGRVALEYVWEVGYDTFTIWVGKWDLQRASWVGSVTTATPSPVTGSGREAGTRRP
jgi:hypothetical protein